MRSVGSASSDTGTILPSGLQVGLGVRPAATYRITSQGIISMTGNPLDVAVNGQGFLQVQLPDGTTAYTRDGALQLNSTGQIVTADGYNVLPSITVPSTAQSITINASGQVLANVAGQTAQQTLGQLQLANFINPVGLDAIGNNLLKETQASGTPTTGNPQSTSFGSLVQGSVESSNVDVVSEVTNLIQAQRAYEMNSKVINTADQMLNTTNQMKS
jgi:flagellar basal-body rod protein FlgG